MCLGKKSQMIVLRVNKNFFGGGGVEGTKAMSYKARKGYIELKVTAELSDNSQRETFFTNKQSSDPLLIYKYQL